MDPEKVTRIHRDDEQAPPPQRGLMRAVFETVDANKGPTDMRAIKELLPAAITDTSMFRQHQIDKALYALVYRGHLVTIEDGATVKWKVAPISYYEARRRYIENRPADHGLGQKIAKARRAARKGITPGLATAIGAAAFAIGLAAGLAIGVLA